MRQMICPVHPPEAVCVWPVSDEDEDASFGDLWNHVKSHVNYDQRETHRLMATVKLEGES